LSRSRGKKEGLAVGGEVKKGEEEVNMKIREKKPSPRSQKEEKPSLAVTSVEGGKGKGGENCELPRRKRVVVISSHPRLTRGKRSFYLYGCRGGKKVLVCPCGPSRGVIKNLLEKKESFTNDREKRGEQRS